MGESATDRFWSHVQKLDDCWIWVGTATPRGYGKLRVNGKPVYAHRFSWELHNGSDPGELYVLHRCDNPACVNPDHLFTGTQSDNINDCMAKGRFSCGEKHSKAQAGKMATGDRNGARLHPECVPRCESHGMAKLNNDQVRDIKARYLAGEKQKDIAKVFSVAASAISRIVNGKRWRELV